MSLDDDIVDIEKHDEIRSPTFVVNEILGLFLHSSIFSNKHLRYSLNLLYQSFGID